MFASGKLPVVNGKVISISFVVRCLRLSLCINVRYLKYFNFIKNNLQIVFILLQQYLQMRCCFRERTLNNREG